MGGESTPDHMLKDGRFQSTSRNYHANKKKQGHSTIAQNFAER